jgi:enterochelin esterase-like enzyme/sugar lactone lactonase YvrE
MRILLLTITLVALLHAEDYTLGPDSQPQPGVPKGALTKHVLPPGKFYPGVPHNYSLYIPAQYNRAKPTPFMIFLDGGGFAGNMRVPIVFDNLIAKGDLPPMIGIFIDPGVLPVLSDTVQNRYNRIFEYDNVSDRYARFLAEELIPEVAKQYKLSKDPNDRGIGGSSTGAVGAFVAAWNRPDQFRRVFTFIGTFVDMKGADHFPALIRKTEAKPLRIYMQDGRKDHIVPNQPWGTFYAGSWPINNQIMYEAFEFSGYDVKYVLGDEGHNGKHGSAIMPEVLRWLWRGYPQPITVHEPAMLGQTDWDPRGKVSSVVSADKPWQRIGETYESLSNPAADREGNVYFADARTGRVYKVDTDGNVTAFKEHTETTRALAVGSDGRLYAAQPGRKRIVSYGPSPDGKGDEKVVATNVDVDHLAANAKGEIYYTSQAQKVVGRIDAHGRSHLDHTALAAPAGIAFSPDQAMLLIADAETRFSWSFQVTADGALSNGEPFYRLEIPETPSNLGATAVASDAIGQVYFATPLGIQICEANGRVATILNSPEVAPVTSLAFAGKNLDWLYVTAGGKLYRRPVKQPGAAAWSAIKPPKPPL